MNSMKFNWKRFNDTVIVSPEEYLSVKNGIDFKEFVEKSFLDDEKTKVIVLDLREVTSIDSFVIGTIVALYKRFQSKDKKLFLLCLKDSHVEEILKQYVFNRIIPIKNELKEILEMRE